MQPKHFESLYPGESRDEEISQIVPIVKEGGSTQLVGLPGVGRSHLLGLLAYNHEVHLRHFPQHHKDVHFLMLNFNEVRDRSLSEVWKFILLNLARSLEERKMTDRVKRVEEIIKKSLSYRDEFVLGQGLKSAIEYLTVDEKLTIIFLCDRFSSFVPQASREFFTMLAALRDRAKYRFSVIFSLSRSLDDLVDQETLHDFSDFVRGNIVYLSLKDEKTLTFRLSYLEKMMGKSISGIDKEAILQLSGGHLRLTKLAYEMVLAGESSFVSGSLLSSEKIVSALKDIWCELTPAEQDALKTGAVEGGDIYLKKIGLWEDGVKIPLLMEWVKSLTPEKEDLSFDAETKNITLGERLLSDDLTKLEHRLLSYLLVNKERVVERNEIVDYVWSEVKSKEGVTEEALDQLIFRLRRKIEKDPNNPTHLLTIKGRGFKLV